MATSLKARIRTMLPAVLQNGAGIVVTKIGLIYQIAMDWSQLTPLAVYTPSVQRIATQSSVDGSFGLVTIAQLLNVVAQVITGAGTVTVGIFDSLIVVNKTVGSATTVNLPTAATKVGSVKVVDWKGDAATNPITINVVGTDKLNGNQTSFVINANGGSLEFTPISDGSGYAV